VSADPRIAAQLAAFAKKSQKQDAMIEQIMELLSGAADAPKYIKNINGRRVPFWAPIEITVAAGSTSKAEAQFTVSQDGPFVMTGIGVWFRPSEGPYPIWGPGNTAHATTSETGQQHGYGYLLDQPHCISCDIEFTDQGSGRVLQERAITSAAFNSTEGPLPLSLEYLLEPNSVLKVSATPTLGTQNAGIIQVVLFGYKIVQGPAYQP
jgi:hypothetical protein